jgi:hypothetical protein
MRCVCVCSDAIEELTVAFEEQPNARSRTAERALEDLPNARSRN